MEKLRKIKSELESIPHTEELEIIKKEILKKIQVMQGKVIESVLIGKEVNEELDNILNQLQLIKATDVTKITNDQERVSPCSS